VVARIISTPLGPMLAAASERGICLLEFVERRMLEKQLAVVERRIGTIEVGDAPVLAELAAQLDEYFGGERTTFDVPIDAPGTPFQERVWAELRRIPTGQTRSYAEVARAVGAPAAARAVARANGMNRVAIVIPCHRVIGTDGALTGYAGGLDRKERLLRLEGRTRSAVALGAHEEGGPDADERDEGDGDDRQVERQRIGRDVDRFGVDRVVDVTQQIDRVAHR
jgi:O-6-methylguanine DNA methyltransferase